MAQELFEVIIQEIDQVMNDFSHTKKDIGYGWRWHFDNGLWFDIIDYKKKGMTLLRVSRGAWLVKQHPILNGYFDVVSKVIAKLELTDASSVERRGLRGLFELMDGMESDAVKRSIVDHFES